MNTGITVSKDPPIKANRQSLQAKIMLFIGLLILLTSTISTIIHVKNFYTNYLEAMEWRSETLARSIEFDIRSRYNMFGETSDIELILQAAYPQSNKLYHANKNQHISFIAVLNADGRIITHNDRTLWGSVLAFPTIPMLKDLRSIKTVRRGENYHTLIPVTNGEDLLLGIIDVGFPSKVVDDKIMRAITNAAILCIIVFLLAFFMAWRFMRHQVSTPIAHLIEATADIANGNLKRDIGTTNTREFQELADGLLHMRDSIRQSLTQLEQKNREMNALMACSPVSLFSIDLKGNVAIWPVSAENMFGWQASEVLGRPLPTVPQEKALLFDELCNSVRAGAPVIGQEFEQRHKDGSLLHVSVSSAPIRRQNGEIGGIMCAMLDISRRIEQERAHRDMQEQLVQAQKMESVGRLAGGVAHDYNNMLSVILGYAGLLLENLEAGEPMHEEIQEIHKAAKRSADITAQLLAFARKQTISPQMLNMNDCVESMLKMLRRLLGENYTINWLPQRQLPPIKMDIAQIDSILVNLCINAKDAMEEGGTITIETQAVDVDADYCNTHIGFTPGAFVCLIVSDTGTGMDKEIKEKIFEPFFTTKPHGKGTGLGLATIYGVVKQNKGFINVYSELGHGSTFRIYFPEYAGDMQKKELTVIEKDYFGQGETILLVEDEAAILKMCRQILENLGYTVYQAQTPKEAIQIATMHRSALRLLLTDVVLQQMNGDELAREVQSICPHIRTLYMSGYTTDLVIHQGIIDNSVQFLQKPFSKRDLAKKVRRILTENAS